MGDLRNAVRSLRSAPIVSAVAVLSLALGIGANTAIFSLLNALTLRPLPVPEPSRLVQLYLGPDRSSWTNPLWEQLRSHPDLFEGACAWSSPRFDLASGGQTDPVNGLWVSGSFFEVLGVHALLGRTLDARDDRRGGGSDGPAAVVSYGFWQRHFNGAADVVGRAITLERISFTIVGVTPPAFTGPDSGRAFDVAVPIGTEPLVRGRDSALDRRSYWWLNVIARLRADQSVEAATAAFRGVQRQMRDATIPDNWRPENLSRYLDAPFEIKPAANGRMSGLRRVYERPLVVMMGVVGLVLLIACANVANLMLARATARRHEMSVRRALGASRWRLARQLLIESLLLACLGAAGGLLLARWGGALLVQQLSTADNPVFLDLRTDIRVLLFTIAVTVVTALVFGSTPALRAAGAEPNAALKEQGRGVAGQSRLAAGHLLVAMQVALSLVLLVGAGLFVRTFVSLSHVSLGFDTERVLVVAINARRSTADPGTYAALFERAREAVRDVPGVADTAASAVTPVSGSTWDTLIEAPDGLSLSEDQRDVYVNLISPRWFATYGTPFIAGRDITSQDTAGSPPVIVVNETFARRFFPGGNPLGHVVRETAMPGEPSPPLQIVGVVRDAVYSSVRAEVPPTMYQALAQARSAPSEMNISVRAAAGSPVYLTRAVAAAIARVDGSLALTMRPLAGDLRATLNQERLVAMLSGFFGALALTLAAVGLYGVMAYSVTRRQSEIGIRMALGATPSSVVALVLHRMTLVVGAGMLGGVGISLWAVRFVAPLVFGLQPRDPLTLAGAVAVLACIGGVAAWLPARRAARMDPAKVLRDG